MNLHLVAFLLMITLFGISLTALGIFIYETSFEVKERRKNDERN